MSKSVIITCAPTGGIHTPTISEHCPLRPAKSPGPVLRQPKQASIIHLHARDPENGKPDPNPDLFMEFLPRIKQATDAVMNISTAAVWA